MWHVLHAAPNCEPQVCKFLGVHGIDGYAPQFPPAPRTKPGSVRDRKHRWVFPGYVFFRPDESFARWDLIRWAPGVRRMLDQDGSPAILAELRPAGRALQKGQPVLIQSGPLRMVDAIFEKNLDATQRVQVLVQLLGRPLLVELDAAIVRAAS